MVNGPADGQLEHGAAPAARGAVAALRALLGRRPLILCYHGIGDPRREDDPRFLRVPTAALRLQLGLLAEAGARFTTVGELAAAARDGGNAAGQVAVSFDDGYEDNRSIALPILQELGIPATVFIATGLIGAPNPFLPASAGQRMMHEAEILELASAGVEIGAHTVTHPHLTQVDAATCERELTESKSRLEELLGRPVTSFAYPYFLDDPAVRAAVQKAGFDAAVTGLAQGGFDEPLALPRALVGGKDGLPTFLMRSWDLYDPLFRSWPVRVLRGASRPARGAVRSVLDRGRSAGNGTG